MTTDERLTGRTTGDSTTRCGKPQPAHVRRRLLVLAVACCSLLSVASAQSALNARQFKNFWRVESESPDYRVSFVGDTCEVIAPKGLTLWRKEKLTTGCAVEYDVKVMDEGHASDRVSDMNVFWLASDPQQRDIWERSAWRSGIFVRCYTLQMYYMGYGGNSNTTTRFRRYTGDAGGVTEADRRPPVLKEYTDPAHLLKGNRWYHLRVETAGGRTRMYVDGECLVDYLDPQPLQSGWFGFRTTWSRIRIANYRSESLKDYSPLSGVPLHWVAPGDGSTARQPVTFGVPFAQGELQDASLLTLDDGTPADAWTNATWPDGSVKWAGMAAVADRQSEPKVVAAKKPKNHQPPMAVETPEQIIVSTDRIRAFIPKHGTTIIDSIIYIIGGTTVSTATRLVADAAVGRVTSAQIERTGRVMTVVRLEGVHDDGRHQWLPFMVRLCFFRGSEQVKLVHSFVYDGDEHRDAIGSLGVRFSVPMREAPYNRHVAFATADGGVWAEPVQPLSGRRRISNPTVTSDSLRTPLAALQLQGHRVPPRDAFPEADRFLLDHWAAWDGYRLSQLTDNAFSVRKRAVSPSATAPATPWIGTFTGTRAPGTVFVGDVSGGLLVGMDDFWQSYPSTIQIDHARSPEAELTMWFWSPESEPMNLCHYDTLAHDLMASYEDVQPGMSSPYGIGRTSVLWIAPQPSYPGKAGFAAAARQLTERAQLLPTPDYLHAKRAFGVWSLPAGSSAVERRLALYLDYYRQAVEQHKWYGFWNYGDLMHAYDPERHSWQYDVGGYAWDNTELATPMWLWYSFLRTGRYDVFRMAEAMTRHNSEVDTYHIGPFAPLGSRHNVTHWGCGAKEARISQSAFLRFYYYLTSDDRTGDLMHQQTDADTLLYHLDPMRLAEPRSQFPCTAPARLRIGPDWMAYVGNWMTEWERTGNQRYRDKILAGMQSIAGLKHGFFTGNLALGYDPATGQISYEGDPDRMTTNHLATIMGGFEVMSELMPVLAPPSFSAAWLDYARRYKTLAREIRKSRFPVRRLMAYAAWQTRDQSLAAEAWHDLWNRIEHEAAPTLQISRLATPDVPAPIDEWRGLSTNDAALWSLDAIYMKEVLPTPSATEDTNP